MLLASALRFLRLPGDPERLKQPPLILLVLSGAGLGLLAGLTGTGGGVVAVHLRQLAQRPGQLGWMLLMVLVAGAVGSRLGSRHWPVAWIRRCLALVLLLAAAKLLGFAG